MFSKGFYYNIHLCFLLALNLLQAKKKGERGSCNVYKICILCIVVNYKLTRHIQ